jgi:hypothetical protein
VEDVGMGIGAGTSESFMLGVWLVLLGAAMVFNFS